MSQVGIVTDSTNCLPVDILQQYDIRVAPYHLFMEDKDYLDQIEITPTEFWKVFKELKTIPTTGVPSPGHYTDIFTELAKSTDSIACITISTALSGAYESAAEAREIVLAEHPDLKIELIDAKTSTGALGFVTLEAARAARADKRLDEVVQIAQGLVPKVKFILALDTLKYLIKGGRAPKTAVIGEVLGVKPLIGVVKDTGLVDSLGKERGKQKAMLRLVDMVREHTDTNKPLHVNVHYTDNMEDGNELKEMVTSQYNCTEIYVTELTPVMATHTGPMVGLSFYS